MALTETDLRRIIREELAGYVGSLGGKFAYSIEEMADLVSYSRSTIYNQIAANRLVPSYANAKPVITAAEIQRWLSSLDPEPPAK